MVYIGAPSPFAEARQIAAKKNWRLLLALFRILPSLAFVRYQPDLLLTSIWSWEREQLLEAQGVDYLYLIDFTSCFAGNKAEDFWKVR